MTTRNFYISNVFEDSVKRERSITTDSPAASGKVIRICRAIKSAGGHACVLSLGRGRQKGTFRWYGARIRRSGNTAVIYAAYWDAPVLTHLVSALALCLLAARFSRRGSAAVFYNCLPFYLPALVLLKLLGRRCLLDLEDGFRSDVRGLKNRLDILLHKVHNTLCGDGVMLASSLLRSQTTIPAQYVCHGVVPCFAEEHDWSAAKVQVLYGGALYADTGAELFLEAIRILGARYPEAVRELSFVVTGSGDCSEKLRQAAQESNGLVTFLGNVDKEQYKEVLRNSHAGLCLKVPSSSMGCTTFPSKVIELAAYGLLVVSTRVSDVPLVFDQEMAVLLPEASPAVLAEQLASIAGQRERYGAVAWAGKRQIVDRYSPQRVGRELAEFWTGRPCPATE